MRARTRGAAAILESSTFMISQLINAVAAFVRIPIVVSSLGIESLGKVATLSLLFPLCFLPVEAVRGGQRALSVVDKSDSVQVSRRFSSVSLVAQLVLLASTFTLVLGLTLWVFVLVVAVACVFAASLFLVPAMGRLEAEGSAFVPSAASAMWSIVATVVTYFVVDVPNGLLLVIFLSVVNYAFHVPSTALYLWFASKERPRLLKVAATSSAPVVQFASRSFFELATRNIGPMVFALLIGAAKFGVLSVPLRLSQVIVLFAVALVPYMSRGGGVDKRIVTLLVFVPVLTLSLVLVFAGGPITELLTRDGGVSELPSQLIFALFGVWTVVSSFEVLGFFKLKGESDSISRFLIGAGLASISAWAMAGVVGSVAVYLVLGAVLATIGIERWMRADRESSEVVVEKADQVGV